MIPETTLIRASDAVMLGSITREHLDCSIITFDGDGDFVDLLGMFQPFDDILVDIEMASSLVKLSARRFER